MTKNKTKATRGRPVIPVNFNFGGRPFTIDNVLARYKGKISRPAVYNKLQKLIAAKKARVVDHKGPRSEGRGHPTYRFFVRAAKAKAAKRVAPVAAPEAAE